MKKSKIAVLVLSLALLFGGGKNNLKLGKNVGETNKNNNIVQRLAIYSSEVYYTLSFTKNTSNTAYATNYEVTINDKKWSVPGNQGLGDHVKIGGKLSSETTRRIYSIDGISGNVGKIIVAHGDKDSAITVVSLTIKAFATAENCKEGTNHISEKVVKNVESEIVEIELDRVEGYNTLFYSLEYTMTSTAPSSNKGLIIKSVEFYEFENDISEIAKNDIKANTTKAQLKYSFDAVQGETVSSFVKVTEAPTDWSGKYLIVYEDGANSVLFDSSLETIDASKNKLSVEIKSNTIEKDKYLSYAFTINQQDKLCSIKSATGKYISGTSGSNALNTSESESFNNEISCNSDGTVNIISNTSHLRYNSASDNLRFRYFKSSSYTTQKAICLYKLTTVNEISYTFYNMKMNFGSFIHKDKFTALTSAGLTVTSYGVAIAKHSSLVSTETVSSALSAKKTYVKTFEKAYDTKTFVYTDETGTLNEGDYVAFSANVVFGDKTAKYVDVYDAVAYVVVDGDYVFLQEKSCSVSSLADEYIASSAFTTFSASIQASLQALGALND